MYIDTHCHLDDERYLNVDEIIKEAQLNNVLIMIQSGYDIKSSENAVEFSKKYESIYATVGIHPSEANTFKLDELVIIEELIKDNKVVAIGEIGLDYHYDNIDREMQKKLFIEQIKIANKYKKPIVVHSRDAINDTYLILKEYKDKDIKFILHCYSSNEIEAEKFIKINGYFGIGGVLTFKNSKVLKEVINKIDLEFFILETDAPYLSPEPFRGQINYPKYIPIISQEISKIKEIDENIVRDMTTKTAAMIFDLEL